jgi:hypothetical protein
MLRSVALVRTDVTEDISASFTRVTRIGELGTTLAVTSNRRTLRRNGISVLIRATRRNIPEDAILLSHRRESLKSYILWESPTVMWYRFCAGLRGNDARSIFACHLGEQRWQVGIVARRMPLRYGYLSLAEVLVAAPYLPVVSLLRYLSEFYVQQSKYLGQWHLQRTRRTIASCREHIHLPSHVQETAAAITTSLRSMASSGMLHHVGLVRIDVSEKLNASFVRVIRIGKLGTMLAVTSNRSTLRRNTKKSYNFS